MLKSSLQKLRLMPKLRIVKFLIIFTLTGSSSVFVSDVMADFIKTDLSYEMNAFERIVLISLLYQFLLLLFCLVFGELPYVIKKFRKMAQLFRRLKN
ncbi:MAG: DUF6787 family protein [Rhodospirillaceae bacterium]